MQAERFQTGVRPAAAAPWVLVAALTAAAAGAASPAAAAPSVAPAQAGAAQDDGFDAAAQRAEARMLLLRGYEELADWCGEKKLFAARADAWRAILALDAENTAALRGLGYWKDREGEWQPPKSPRAPRDIGRGFAEELAARRAAAVGPFRARLLDAWRAAAEVPGARRRPLLEALLEVLPDDAEARALLGEVRMEERWVLPETLRAKERRAELRERVKALFARLPHPKEVEPDAREQALGVRWTAAVATPSVRVLGTVEQREALRCAQALHVAREYFEAATGRPARYADDFTVFLLDGPGQLGGFLEAHPAVDGAYRDFLMKLEGSGIQGTGDMGHWAPNEQRRLDGMVRQALGWLFADAFGVTTETGWVYEGFGLYMTRELIGTRLTWFVMPSDYLKPQEDQALRARLLDSRTNWMNEALQLLAGGKGPKLRFVVGKSVNTLSTEDLLLSYVAAAYLLEGRPETIPAILERIGAGTPSQQALEEVLGTDVLELDARIRRWLEERR